MIDISKAKSELSPCIKFIVNWFEENGFNGAIVTYNTSKTVIMVNKDGVSDRFEITAAREKMDKLKGYMEAFAKSFAIKCENEKMKRELALLRGK